MAEERFAKVPEKLLAGLVVAARVAGREDELKAADRLLHELRQKGVGKKVKARAKKAKTRVKKAAKKVTKRG